MKRFVIPDLIGNPDKIVGSGFEPDRPVRFKQGLS
jgi:hypothetical protein